MKTLSLLFVICALAFGDSLVVPNVQTTAPGNTPVPIGATASRFQEVVGSGQFGGPIVITGLRVRATAGAGPVSVQWANQKITLSTTPVYPNTNNGHTLLSATYANNVGPDATVVFNGPISLTSPGCDSPGPCPFDMVIPFSAPFPFDASKGRLLVDIVSSAPTSAPAGTLDGVSFADSTLSTVAIVIGDPSAPTGTMNLAGLVFGLDSGSSSQEILTTPAGSFGFLLRTSIVNSMGNSGIGIIGIMNFNGAGNVTGSYIEQSNGKPGKNGSTVSGTFSGSYFSYADGTGSVTINLPGIFSLPMDLVITAGGQAMQLVATNCFGNCDLTGVLVEGTARAAYAGSPQGNYGFKLDNTPFPSGTLGVINFDGAGNATVSYTSIGAGTAPGQTPVSSGTQTGTYVANGDGSGLITFGPQTVAFVTTDGGAGLLLLQTAGTVNNVSFGSARLE